MPVSTLHHYIDALDESGVVISYPDYMTSSVSARTSPPVPTITRRPECRNVKATAAVKLNT